MKICFGFPVASDRSSSDAARRIVALLQQKGDEVLTRHFVNGDPWLQERFAQPQQVYQRGVKWLDQGELFLAEVSGSSFGLGVEAGYLQGGSANLYKRGIAGKISSLIAENSRPSCVLAPYRQVVELETFIDDHV